MKHVCYVHGEIYVSPQKALNGLSGFGCQKCGIEDRNFRLRITEKTLKDRLFKKHGDAITVLEYKNSIIDKHDFLCNKCGYEWQTTLDSVLRTSGCFRCNDPIQSSRISTQWIDKIAKLLDTEFWHASNGGEMLIRLPSRVQKIRLDGYSEKYKLALEFHGDTWHGNLGVFDVDSFPNPRSTKTAGELYTSTIEREDAIAKAGYQLVTLWELDGKRGYLYSDIKGPNNFPNLKNILENAER